jgi:phosphoribosylglycinamide formyltransferase-1
MVVRWFAEGRISLSGTKVAVAGLPEGATLLFSADP